VPGDALLVKLKSFPRQMANVCPSDKTPPASFDAAKVARRQDNLSFPMYYGELFLSYELKIHTV
jgi:hypothetical protein